MKSALAPPVTTHRNPDGITALYSPNAYKLDFVKNYAHTLILLAAFLTLAGVAPAASASLARSPL